MRAALAGPTLAALMHFYPGFKPWEIEQYRLIELEALMDSLPD